MAGENTRMRKDLRLSGRAWNSGIRSPVGEAQGHNPMRIRAVFFQRAVVLVLGMGLGLAAGCAARAHSIPGTKVADSDENREILGVIEKYRLAVERKDAPAIMTMASKRYWEDGGTPTGADDYGYDGLREVLVGRFQRADEIRYSLKYLRIRRQGERAFVDVMVDASYSINSARGDERHDERDQNQFVLEREGERWLFVSGM